MEDARADPVKVVELGMGSSRFELRVSALAGFGARVFAVALIIRLNCAGSRPILERRARVHAAVRRSYSGTSRTVLGCKMGSSRMERTDFAACRGAVLPTVG